MISYTYSYLIADMVFLVIWFSLFIWRKDVRKQMLVISLTLGIIATFLEYIYIQDWWHPLTITHTIIGVEDFIFSFTISGISTVIYEEIFKKKIRLRKENSKTEIKRDKKMFLIIILCLALFLGGFYLLKLSSFYSSVLAFSIPLIIVLNKRKDLFLDSFISGIFLAGISFLAFNIPEAITPGWIKSTWCWENLSGIVILKAPIEDLIWFFLVGMFIAPLYEYWLEGRLINKK